MVRTALAALTTPALDARKFELTPALCGGYIAFNVVIWPDRLAAT